MIIVIEGCDGTGKSTIAEAVVDEVNARIKNGSLSDFPVKFVHHGPPERSPLEEYATDIEGQDDIFWVFDRHHLGELVYPSLYRNQGPFGALGVAGFRWVEKFLQARGTAVYVIDAPYAVVAKRLATRGEDYLQSHHVEHVLGRFREVARELSIVAGPDTLPCARSLGETPKLAKRIVDDALATADKTASLRAFPSYVGGPRPEVLLVGEKRGGQPPFESGACFMPLKNKSGQFLWDYLPDPYWKGVGVANAKEDHIGALWMTLGQPPIVALGREASRTLDGISLKHAAVPHPQAVKRFAHRRGVEYGELIQAVTYTHEKEFGWLSS